MRLTEAGFKISLFTLRVESTTAPEFIDITDRVGDFVRQSDIRNGTALVFSKHTTVAITIQENEPLLLGDMANTLERLSPRKADYRHNDFSVRTVNMHEDECPNGHAHCQHLLMSTSETIPIIDGELQLGRWQSVFLVELDRPRTREVVLQVIGE